MNTNNTHDILEQMKKLFKDGEYERLLYFCNQISEEHPQSYLAKKYSKKARFMLANKDVKWAIAGICVAITILISGIVHMNQKIDTELKLKELQVNSLIDELGTIREENLFLKEKIDESENYLNLAMSSINSLDEKIATFADGDESAKVTKKLQEMQTAVNQFLSKQKDTPKPQASSKPVVELNPVNTEEYKKTTNILVLGTHATLTDTIMIASVNPDLGTVSLISLPRDLFVHGRKINSVYNLYGPHKIAEYATEITGLPIHKYVVVNLQAFIEIVDIMGGLKINNEKDIYDTLYPGPNYSYTTFSLKKGEHILDGQTALKYARSRKSTSDFDRSKRQQQIIAAAIDKAKNFDFVDNIERLQEIYDIIAQNLDTNISVKEGAQWINSYKNFTLERGNTIDNSNYLYPTRNTAGQYILLPKKKNYTEIQEFVKNLVLN